LAKTLAIKATLCMSVTKIIMGGEQYKMSMRNCRLTLWDMNFQTQSTYKRIPLTL